MGGSIGLQGASKQRFDLVAGGAVVLVIELHPDTRGTITLRPFVKGGGLFIPTNRSYALGDEVFILLSLIDEPERIPIAGTVVWVTPKGPEGNRASGIGVQFNNEDNGAARNKISRSCISNV